MTDEEFPIYVEARKEALSDADANKRPQLYVYADSSLSTADLLLSWACKSFAAAIYDKAQAARKKHKFHPFGWATPDWEAELQRGLAEHVQKGDPRDVGVYAMFAWFHGWSTALPVPDEHDGVIPASALFWKNAALKAATPSEAEFNMREAYNHIVGQLYANKRTIDRLVEETHNWSAAVKKLEAERAAPAAAPIEVEAGGPDDEVSERLAKIMPALIKIAEQKDTVWATILQNEYGAELFDFAEWAHNYLVHLRTKAAARPATSPVRESALQTQEPFLPGDYTDNEWDTLLDALKPLDQKHSLAVQLAYQAVLNRLKADSPAVLLPTYRRDAKGSDLVAENERLRDLVERAKEMIDARQEQARIDAATFPSSADRRAAANDLHVELSLIKLALDDDASTDEAR